MRSPVETKNKLLNAALMLIRTKGYAATTVDDICQEAGVTKGSFFHHFKSKDELALAAIDYWNHFTGEFFASAAYHQPSDPYDRLIGYVDFRDSILRGDIALYTCLLGTLVQETYQTHPELQKACNAGAAAHIAEITKDVAEAKRLYAPNAPWTPDSVGYFIQSVIQGSFIFAKARQGPEVIHENLDHLKRYLAHLFNKPQRGEL